MTKRIVLLADGTGNGLLRQLSNVYRISTALDRSTKKQLVYYIPGVGTQGFKPVALLDGATGWGVPSNVRKLHRLLSWSWEPGDAIYMFGFSRGAFTIRMLVDLIAKEGLLPVEIDRRRVSHLDMVRHSEMAWRSFCANDPTRNDNIWIKLGVRKLRDAALARAQKKNGQPDYATVAMADPDRRPAKVKIDFLGLFDTVEAYGVPIEEARNFLHRYVIPIRFGGDHSIWENVVRARQALSLDDERLTFHPIRASLHKKDLKTDRIQEVWFSGVHSDVGGGYPDDMTAHAPLLWMIGEADLAARGEADRKLTYRNGEVEKFATMATPFGPLHDSRAGSAAFYRYDPRVVAQADAAGNPYFPPTIHHTVVQRLVEGWDEYAPLALGAADVVMPDGAIARAQDGANYLSIKKAEPSETPAILESGARAQIRARADQAMRKLDAPRKQEMDVARDYVWLKKRVYWLSAATIAVAIILIWMLPLIAALPVGVVLALTLHRLQRWNDEFSDAIQYHARRAWSVQGAERKERPVTERPTLTKIARERRDPTPAETGGSQHR